MDTLLSRQSVEVTSNIAGEPSAFHAIVNDLAANYFPSSESNMMLGRFVTIVNPQLKKVCEQYGQDIYDKMILTDAKIEQIVLFLHKSISTFTTVPVARDDHWKSRFLAEYVRRTFAGIENYPENEIKNNYDLIRYGVSYSTLSYSRKKIFELNPITLSDFDDLCIKDILEVRNNVGRIVGYLPTGGLFRRFMGEGSYYMDWILETVQRSATTESSLKDLGNLVLKDTDDKRKKEVFKVLQSINFVTPFKIHRVAYLPTSDSFNGSKGLMDVGIHYWWLRQQIIATLLYYVQNYSFPIKHGSLAEGVKTVTVKDASGKDVVENGSTKTTDAKMDFKAKIVEAAKGGTIVTPNGYLLSYIEADHQIVPYLWDLYNNLGKEMQDAMLLQGSTLSSETTGSNAESQKPLLYLNVHYLKQQKKIAYNKLYTRIVNLTFPNFVNYTPVAHTGTLNGMPMDLTEIGVLNQSDFFDEDQKRKIAAELHLPS